MLSTFKLLLPAVIPSWRFFESIAPSPRIEYAEFDSAQKQLDDWQVFRPRPKTLSIAAMLKRMVWNPEWNEDLFLMSCAERLIQNPTQHSEDEILRRIGAVLEPASGCTIQFRLAFINREGETLEKHILYTSRPYMHNKGAV